MRNANPHKIWLDIIPEDEARHDVVLDFSWPMHWLKTKQLIVIHRMDGTVHFHPNGDMAWTNGTPTIMLNGFRELKLIGTAFTEFQYHPVLHLNKMTVARPKMFLWDKRLPGHIKCRIIFRFIESWMINESQEQVDEARIRAAVFEFCQMVLDVLHNPWPDDPVSPELYFKGELVLPTKEGETDG
jgi:hypothetical protein